MNKSVLERAKRLVIPTKSEEQKVTGIVDEVIAKVSSQIAKSKLNASLFVGGSVAKGTWLPGISDIDFFI